MHVIILTYNNYTNYNVMQYLCYCSIGYKLIVLKAFRKIKKLIKFCMNLAINGLMFLRIGLTLYQQVF